MSFGCFFERSVSRKRVLFGGSILQFSLKYWKIFRIIFFCPIQSFKNGHFKGLQNTESHISSSLVKWFEIYFTENLLENFLEWTIFVRSKEKQKKNPQQKISKNQKKSLFQKIIRSLSKLVLDFSIHLK